MFYAMSKEVLSRAGNIIDGGVFYAYDYKRKHDTIL